MNSEATTTIEAATLALEVLKNYTVDAWCHTSGPLEPFETL